MFAKAALFAAANRGTILKVGLGLIVAALLAWGFYALVIKPRDELRDTREQLDRRTAERDQAASDLAAFKLQASMKAVLAQAQIDVANDAAAERQRVADKATARAANTQVIQTRIVERVTANGDGLATDNMDSFLDDLGEVK